MDCIVHVVAKSQTHLSDFHFQCNYWLDSVSCMLSQQRSPWEEKERKLKSLSSVRLFATPWTIQSMEFSRPDTGVGSLSLLQGIFPT